MIMENNNIHDMILARALVQYGFNAQIEMIIEECSELILALQKLKRTNGDNEEKLENVIDEVADVKIMIRQAEIMFGEEKVNERVCFKMNRLYNRLSSDKELISKIKI